MTTTGVTTATGMTATRVTTATGSTTATVSTGCTAAAAAHFFSISAPLRFAPMRLATLRRTSSCPHSGLDPLIALGLLNYPAIDLEMWIIYRATSRIMSGPQLMHPTSGKFEHRLGRGWLTSGGRGLKYGEDPEHPGVHVRASRQEMMDMGGELGDLISNISHPVSQPRLAPVISETGPPLNSASILDSRQIQRSSILRSGRGCTR